MHKALNVARLLLVLLGCCAFLLLAGPAQAEEDPIGALGDSGPEQAAEGASGVSGGPASAEADKTEDTAKEALDGSAQATDDAVSKFDRDAASQDRSETVEESNEGAEPAAADGDVDGTPLRPEANVKAAAADDTLDAVEATARVAADARDNAGARQAEAEQSASELINLVQRTSDDGLETATTELARAPADVLQKTSDRVAAPAEKTITRMHDTVTQVVEVAHSATKTDKIMRPVRDAAEGASELVDEAFTSVGTVAVPTVEKAASDLDETAGGPVEEAVETISAVGAHIDETVTADLDETAGGPVVEETVKTISAVGAHIDETVTADLDETAGGPVVEEAVKTISAVAAHVDETIAHSAQAGRSVSGAPEDAGGLVAEPVVKDLEEASVADPTRLVEGAVTPVDPRLKRDGSELSTVATSPLLVAEPVPVGSASLGSAQAPRQSPQPAQLAPSGPPTRAPVKPSAPGWTLQARPAQLAPSASGGRVDLFTFEPTLEAGPARVQVPSWPTQDQPVVPGTPLAHTTGSLGGAGPGQSDNFTALVEGLAALLALLLLGVLGIATLTARSRFHAPLVSPG